MLAGAQPLQHPCWCHKWVWGLKKSLPLSDANCQPLWGHYPPWWVSPLLWALVLQPMPSAVQPSSARKGSMIPRYSEFHDVHVAVKSFEVSPWFPHAVWIFGTTIGWSLCGTCGTCGDVKPRQDANIVADASFLRSGMDGHLDRLDQRVMSCKESRNPSAVCIGCIGPTTFRVDTKCDLESIQLSWW